MFLAKQAVQKWIKLFCPVTEIFTLMGKNVASFRSKYEVQWRLLGEKLCFWLANKNATWLINIHKVVKLTQICIQISFDSYVLCISSECLIILFFDDCKLVFFLLDKYRQSKNYIYEYKCWHFTFFYFILYGLSRNLFKNTLSWVNIFFAFLELQQLQNIRFLLPTC